MDDFEWSTLVHNTSFSRLLSLEEIHLVTTEAKRICNALDSIRDNYIQSASTVFGTWWSKVGSPPELSNRRLAYLPFV